MSSMPPFDEPADPHLRLQILTYLASAAMTDRERARFLGLPDGCRIREGAKILAPEKFTCGRDVWIGEGAILDAQGGLTIGDDCQIGLHVFIWTHSSHRQALAGETGKTRAKIEYTPTRIGNRCFIAGPSVVLAGVTIGDGVIVPPMSVVDSDLASGAVFHGPQRRIRDLERTVARLSKEISELKARWSSNESAT